MFRWIVRHARWLAAIPGAPQLFDAALLTWTALFHRERFAALEVVEATARTLPGVVLCAHRFGGIGFSVGEREFAHLHGNGLLDCKVGRSQREALIATGAANPHHVVPGSGWTSFWVRSEEDVASAVTLLKLAYNRERIASSAR